MRIGELARTTGASVRSLRYYEEQGLLTAERSHGGTHRVYDKDAVDRVRLLRQLYSAGLSSAVIASLLPCVDAPSTQVTRESVAILQSEYARLGEQLHVIEQTRQQLSYIMECANQYLADSSN
ncbi:MerR family transcriptional regulator [Branchiibius sp. NY16-3462-2]|uniref:MerR family transcriptional regulator n=1 Tax=Branchiibius sp. NY16-3462-2 TaxID=1807500 RepID=UPI000799BD71|nr:MerR family transcriptional regulator [Branchiibius sp. NY16-3462-2]KYH45352.1 hypothetical protein AZH51_05630 [Branchiibius sp. NY16-3462-2]